MNNKKLFLCLALLANAFILIGQTQRTRAYLYTRYETGDRPSETDFKDVFETFFSRSQDSLPLTQIVGIDGILSTDATLSTASNRQVSSTLALKTYIDNAVAVGGGPTDGDKGDIVISSSGTVFTIDALAVTGAKVAASTLDSTKIATGGLGNTDYAALSITGSKIANSTIDSTKIITGGLGNTDYAALSITGSKIAASTLDSTKVATGGIGNTDLAPRIVTLSKQAPGTANRLQGFDASGNPVEITTAGSVSISGGVLTGTGDDISGLPSASVIAAPDKVPFGDSLNTAQQLFNQMRDSTIFSAATYTDIRKLSTTLKNGDRIKVKDTGVEYLVQATAVSGYTTDTIAVIPVAGGKFAVMQYGNGYLLSGFNVKSTNDSITNRINLQRAFNYVGATGKPNLYWDKAGTIKLFSTTSIGFLFPGRNLNFIGMDTTSTILDIYPKSAGTTAFMVFALTQSSNSNQLGNISFSDIKFSMPTSYSNTTWPIVGAISLLGGGAEVTLTRVSIRGASRLAVYFGGANTDDGLTKRVLTLNSCFIEAWNDASAASSCVQYTGGRWENYLYATNTVFYGAGGNTGSGAGHQLYLQPWLNCAFNGCTFGGNTTVGQAQLIQFNQTTSGTWPSWAPTKFQTFKNCTFVAGSYHALNLDKNYFTPGPIVENCKFFNTGNSMDVKNYGQITDCYFTSTVRLATDTGNGFWSIDGCRFVGCGINIAGGTASKDIKVSVSNCSFTGSAADILKSELTVNDTVRANYNVSNCVFLSGVTGNNGMIYQNNSTMNFSGCFFLGKCFFESGTNSRIYVNNCTWSGPSGGDRMYMSTSASSINNNIFEVRNTRLDYTYGYPLIEDRSDSTRASRVKWFFPDFVWPNYVNIPSDRSPDSLSVGYGLYDIADPSTRDSIVNIQINDENASVTTLNADLDWRKHVNGVLRLRAKNAFKLGTSGNINLPARYQVAIRQTVSLRYNPTTAKWDCLDCFPPTASPTFTGTVTAPALVMTGRIQGNQGADVASASDLTLGNGNLFYVTGTTDITAITTTGWQNGSEITLRFQGVLNLAHNTAGGGGTLPLYLDGATNIATTANDVITFVLTSAGWLQKGAITRL